MKIEVSQTTFERVTKTVEYDLPTVPVYYFITGVRNAYALYPQFSLRDNSLYKYDVIKVGLSFECTLDKFSIPIHEIPNLLNNHKCKSWNIVQQLISYPKDGIRTKEQFHADLDNAMTQIRNLLK